MNPLSGAFLLFLLVVIVTTARRWAILGVFAGLLYLTQGVQLDIGGFNMFATRFLEIAAFFRVVVKNEFSFRKLNQIDKLFIAFNIFTTAVYLLRASDGQAFQIGVTVDSLFSYFAFRGLIKDENEFRQFCADTIKVMIPFTVCVLIESATRQNVFSFMGGVNYGDWMREGRHRCQGSFRHPSLLGTLGACMIPLYFGLFLSKAKRGVALFGILLCLAIVVASNSGGPLNATCVAVFGWAFWRVRHRMKFFRWFLLICLVVAGFAMKAPIWYIFAKASALTGGDGWHRSYLMDVAFQNIDKWWFAGMPLANTWDWFPYGLTTTGTADITNIFIYYGLTAGIGAIILFVIVLYKAFQQLGLAMGKTRDFLGQKSAREYILWGIGVTLTVHIVNWFGITYFDQTNTLWLMQFAALSSLTSESIRSPEIRSASNPADISIADTALPMPGNRDHLA